MTKRVWLLSGLHEPTKTLVSFFFLFYFKSTAFQPFKSVLEHKENHMIAGFVKKERGHKSSERCIR